jgi:hypothetical protein
VIDGLGVLPNRFARSRLFIGSASETSVFGKGEALSLTISSASQTQVTLIRTPSDAHCKNGHRTSCAICGAQIALMA